MDSFPRYYSIGDACLCWAFSDGLDEDTVKRTISIYKKLKDADLTFLGIHDVVPSYKSVALHFDPAEMTGDKEKELDNLVRREWDDVKDGIPVLTGRDIVLPVHYDGDDLDRVAKHCGFSPDEVIERHSAGRYLVAMVGFQPHFPYLMGLDPALETPRLDSPRTRIPAGAVAIGGAQTGIYPRESPGGWNLIGQTNPALLEEVLPGDTIIMERADEN